MNCKACNTRMPNGAKACPHCGHVSPRNQMMGDASRSDSADASSDSSPGPLSPSSALDEEVELDEELEEIELDLGSMADDPSDSSSQSAAPKRPKAKATPRRDGDAKARRRRRRRASPSPDSSASGPREGSAKPATGLLPLTPEQLRHLISESPDLLEPGLKVLGEEGRRQLGIGQSSEAGEIDLLARSASDEWVVVFVNEGATGPSVVSDVLRSVGWVRKHVCEAGDVVRAIVLLESLDEELGYAAAAVADTISFRTWRVSIEFDAVEV